MAIYVPFNEGEQAEEYLKRKMDEKEASEVEANKDRRYVKRNPDAWQMQYNEPTGRRSVYAAEQNPTTAHDPKFDKARSIEKHREKYSDVMPKSKTKSEQEIEKSREKEQAAKDYADRAVYSRNDLSAGNYQVGTFGNASYGDSKEDYYEIDGKKIAAKDHVAKFQSAHDAARRHYRRTHKNEACGIFESVDMI